MAFTKTGPIIPFCKVPVLSFDILPEDIDRFWAGSFLQVEDQIRVVN